MALEYDDDRGRKRTSGGGGRRRGPPAASGRALDQCARCTPEVTVPVAAGATGAWPIGQPWRQTTATAAAQTEDAGAGQGTLTPGSAAGADLGAAGDAEAARQRLWQIGPSTTAQTCPTRPVAQ